MKNDELRRNYKVTDAPIKIVEQLLSETSSEEKFRNYKVNSFQICSPTITKKQNQTKTI